MKLTIRFYGMTAALLIAFCAGSAFAWDSRWQLKQHHFSNSDGAATRYIEMRKRFDHDAMNAYKGTIDGSNGYTILRNSDGGIMRGYIDKDGSGLLRDQAGNYHRVDTRK
ncbi:MAG: hypothetical protein R6V84_07690 [Desulfobacterales bacterium]